MKKKYRVVIAGLGNIAWRFDNNLDNKRHILTHASAYLRNQKTKIVGGCSPDKEDRLSFEKAFNVSSYCTLEEAVDNTNPDIISICSPTNFHFVQTMYCLEKEIPMIWLEKPPAISLFEHDQLISVNKRHEYKSKVLVNYQRRYSESYIKLRSLYREKKLGECRMIQINYSRGLETNGSHMLDIIFFILGDECNPTLNWIKKPTISENPSIFLSIENGPDVIISGLILSYHCIDIIITFDLGRASIIYGGMEPRVETKKEHEFFPGFYRLKEEASTLLGSKGIASCMEEALKDLIESFESNQQPRSNLITSRKTQDIIEEIRKGKS